MGTYLLRIEMRYKARPTVDNTTILRYTKFEPLPETVAATQLNMLPRNEASMFHGLW